MRGLLPRPVLSWERLARIRRYEEIWAEPDSVVHRLPDHYKQRLWEQSVLPERTPVHWRPARERFYQNPLRREFSMLEHEDYPVLPIYPPEADQGLWGGEGVLKGYREGNPFRRKKILPRHWNATFWWPQLQRSVFHSEILNCYLSIVHTQRTLKLIDANFGFDFYILCTPDIDLCSKLGMKLKRHMMVALASEQLPYSDETQIKEILEKYAEFKVPLGEAEWVGYDINEACKKLQYEELTTPPRPLKFDFEQDLVKRLKAEQMDKSLDAVSQKSKSDDSYLSRLNPLKKLIK